ncbi:unnamed protein product [Auanema sp. JU1783]|nr:unnamed protein product [Auanema sp. JU1783]
MASTQELACVYAALILQDEGVPILGEKISTILNAAKIEFEPFWPGLFAKALEGVNVKEMITSVSSGVGSGPAAAAAPSAAPAGGAAAPAEDKKKKDEPKEESDDDMGFGLFD